jgi:hypothetical protein
VRVVCLTAALAVLLLGALLAADAQALARCNISGKERRLGPTYVTSLSTARVSCRRAERLVRSFHRCRRARTRGPRGRCRRAVSGYRCRERILGSGPTQFDSRVTCRRGSRRVTHAYTQFT